MKVNIRIDRKNWMNSRLSILLYVIVMLVIFLVLCFWPKESSPENNIPEELISEPIPQPEPEQKIYKETIPRGKTLSDILEKYNFSPQEIHKLREEVKPVYDLRKILAQNELRICVDQSDCFLSMEYEIDKDQYLTIDKQDGTYTAEIKKILYKTRVTQIYGFIRDNLISAINSMEEGDLLALQLAEIFAWDIDFHTDLRVNDSFKIIFEKKYLDDAFVKYGNILAAEFTNQGKTFHAFRYTYPDTGKWDYFDVNGNSLRKEFMKSPLKFARISSRYSMSRFHPIHKVYRPHLGVDYAAPTGTGVQVTAPGTVLFAGWKGAGGRIIHVKHNNSYETYYMHLSGVGRGIKKGAKVEGGQIIGYVGATGDATGPHLDYRIKYKGKFINPLAWRFQPVEPLRAEFKQAFAAEARDYLIVFDAPLIVLARYNHLSFPEALYSSPQAEPIPSLPASGSRDHP